MLIEVTAAVGMVTYEIIVASSCFSYDYMRVRIQNPYFFKPFLQQEL